MTKISTHDRAEALGVAYKTGDLLTDIDANFDEVYTAPVLMFKQSSNVVISNTTIKTNMLYGVGFTQFNANTLAINDTFRISISGLIQNTGTPTSTIDITIGGVVVTSSILAMPALSGICHFSCFFEFRIITIGSTGSLIGQGLFTIKDSATESSSISRPLIMTNTTTINTNIQNDISVNYTWGTASSSNSLTCTNATILKLQGAGWLESYTYDVWVNLINNGNFVDSNGWTLPSGGTIANNYFNLNGTTTASTNKFLYRTTMFSSNANRRYAVCFKLKTNTVSTNYKFNIFINNGSGAYSSEEVKITPSQNITTDYVVILNSNSATPNGTNQRLYFNFDGTYGVGAGLNYDISITNIEVLDLGYNGGNFYNISLLELKKYYNTFGYFEGFFNLQKVKKADFSTNSENATKSLASDSITGINTIKPFFNKKLVTIGDSNTQSNIYQPFIVNFTGMKYDSIETISGKNGHYPMGLGGTTLVPLTNASGVSIYTRSKDAVYYSPDVIIIYCSGNDGSVTGTINDSPYTGNEVALGGSVPCTVYAAYKGMIENLMSYLPSCLIVISGILVDRIDVNNDYTIDGAISWQNTYRLPWHNLAKDIANYYNLPFVDAWHDSGINSRNATPYFFNPSNFGSPTGLVRNVHFNTIGGERLANCIIKKALM